MNLQGKWLEAVPNFSEGKNEDIIWALKDAISSVKGVLILHIDMSADANRTVITFAGPAELVLKASFLLIQKATTLIDMRLQKGIHPRQGAVDVFPLIPMGSTTMKEAIDYAQKLGEKIGNELHIPVYLYEKSATETHRTRLEQIRKGEYEGFKEKIKLPDWKPNFGAAIFNEKSGNIVLGARNFLLAYNVNLQTNDVSIAKEIASIIRESGSNGKAGLLKNVKAIGWWVNHFGLCQVSTNITNFNETPIHLVFETIKTEAKKMGIATKGSELIGLIPQKALEEAAIFYGGEKADLDIAINKLGLLETDDFNVETRVLEKIIEKKLNFGI